MIKEERNSKEYLKVINDLNEMILSLDTKENTYLDKAKNYYLKHQKELYTYLEYAYLENNNNNNLSERIVKNFVIGRKNWLFSKTKREAFSSAALYSLIYTAKSNGLISEKYLEYLIKNINKLSLDDLLSGSDNILYDIKIK